VSPPSPTHGLHPPPPPPQAALSVAVSGEQSDTPHLHSLRLALPSSAPRASAYEAWRGLTLELRVGWPLRLLLHKRSRARYAELFRFLLLVKRVQMELHTAWTSQTQSGGLPTQQRALLMPLWRLRAHMSFLVDNLQYYLQVDVLEAQWQAFMSTAATCEDFEELSAAHEACLSALHAQCFLQASSVSTALHQIFQLCLSLCRMLSYSEAGARAEATYRSQFATVSREFSRQSAFLFAFLSNMSSPQQSPHLAQLLLRLNFNQFFQVRASGTAGTSAPGAGGV
jgi:gamma-tubulin complex component 4